MNTEEKVNSIILDIVNILSISLEYGKEISLLDIGFDSVQLIELIVRVEEEFDIVFDDSDFDLDKISSYDGIIDIINNKINVE